MSTSTEARDPWAERVMAVTGDAVQRVDELVEAIMRCSDEGTGPLVKLTDTTRGPYLLQSVEDVCGEFLSRTGVVYDELSGPHDLEDFVARARTHFATVGCLARTAMDPDPEGMASHADRALENYVIGVLRPWWEEGPPVGSR